MVTNWDLAYDEFGIQEATIDMAKILWDKIVPGLGVRQNKRSKNWILKYRVNGQQRIVTLGPVGILDTNEARALAKRMKWEGKNGVGPEIKTRYPRITVKCFCEEYIERHAKLKKRSWKNDQGLINQWVIPEWGNRDLKSISRREVSALHAKVTATPAPTRANRLVEQLQKMFNLAVEWGYLPEGSTNPAKGIERNPETKALRWLNDQELARLAPALESLPTPQRVFYWLLILTGCRYSELLNLRWSDVDLDRGTLKIRQTKNGTPHLVPLPAVAVGLMLELPLDNEWVFAGRDGQNFKRMDKTWQRLRGPLGMSDVRIHDFRHTTASHLVQKGYSLKVVAELLNHKTLSTTMRYAHVSKEHVRDAQETLALHVMPAKDNALDQLDPERRLSRPGC